MAHGCKTRRAAECSADDGAVARRRPVVEAALAKPASPRVIRTRRAGRARGPEVLPDGGARPAEKKTGPTRQARRRAAKKAAIAAFISGERPAAP